MIDLHCHILPGLDDGASDLEEALEMCRIASSDGIRTIVATPHMLNGMFAVDTGAVHRGVADLREALKGEGIPIEILPGADVHLDLSLPERAAEGEVVTVAGRGRHLLLELPQDIVPREVGEVIFRLQLKGITPIITHPERNVEIQQHPGLLNRLIEQGSLTQITAGSLTGAFGSRVRECALKLLHARAVHVVATDAHNTGRRSPRLSEARRVVEEELGPEEAEIIFDDRPGKILEGIHVDPPEPIAGHCRPKKKGAKGFWRRIFSYS